VKLDKGPAEYLRALASGDPEKIAEAKEFQRESFRAKFGCYPEELKECTCEDGKTWPYDKCTCPGWADD
jgi:hypothetical protein